MKRSTLLFLCLGIGMFLTNGNLKAQCVIDTLVPNVPGIYPDTFPPYTGCNYGESDVTFLFPRDTMVMIAGQLVTVPFESFTITGIAGLPLGLSWQCNLMPDCIYDVNPSNPNPDTLGCAKVFGTPSIPGTYPIVVYLDVDLGPFLGITQASYMSSITVTPCVFTGSCYDFTVSSNCQPAVLDMENNVPSNGNPQYTYSWSVSGPGLSYTTSDENPFPQMLSQPGEYILDYTLEVDTIGFILDSVIIDSVNCSDAVVNTEPDIYWILKDPQGTDVVNTSASPLNNFNNFPLNIGLPATLLDTGVYEFQVWDEDNLIPDEGCATSTTGSGASVFFATPPAGAGAYTIINDGLRVTFHVSHPIQVITCTDTIVIDSLPSVPGIMAMGDTVICEGDSVELITASGDSLQWFLDGFPLLNAHGNSLVVKEEGSYSVIAINRMTLCQVPSASIDVEVIVITPPNIGLNMDLFSISSPDPASTYTWYRNGMQVGTGDMHTALASGTFWAIRTDTVSGCMSQQSGSIVYTAVGLDPLVGWINQISIFPNPNEGLFSLQMNILQHSDLSIKVFDMVGKVVSTETTHAIPGQLSKTFDLSNFSKGVYMMQIEMGGGSIHRKIIVQ